MGRGRTTRAAGRDRKTYLFAFLDDHTRLAVGYRFGFAEDAVRLAAALRPALAAAVFRPGSTWTTAARSSMRGCCGRARNSVCAWCIRHLAGPKAGQGRTLVSQRA
ncbi:putative transposase domain protein [Mycobacterium xenopi 4042]|uniref:Putative transposase domain protein n=1 Tax=Mycobacterium xenopi 4042 TaxID=1299334 RepID=X8ALF3_MYCXE|nr:putative transposase domain protein [Mycobacterium xenopi 4042]